MSIDVPAAPDKQVVSKKRVADHGEVFTAKREVDAMLDLVRDETQRIESRFLEPACGTGNFLVEILLRKLDVVASRYKKSHIEFERYAILAVSSIYGIDLLEDNAQTCRQRLFDTLNDCYLKNLKTHPSDEYVRAVKFILSRNIECGDALTLKTVGEDPKPIVFSEWSMVNGNIIRRDYAFHELVAQAAITELPLFSDLGDEVFIPEPVKEFPMMTINRIADV